VKFEYVHNSWLTNFWVTACLNQFFENSKMENDNKKQKEKRLERPEHAPSNI